MLRSLYRPDVYFFVASFLRHLATILSGRLMWISFKMNVSYLVSSGGLLVDIFGVDEW